MPMHVSANPAPAALPRLAPTLKACGWRFSRITFIDAATASAAPRGRSGPASRATRRGFARHHYMSVAVGILVEHHGTSRFSNRTRRSRPRRRKVRRNRRCTPWIREQAAQIRVAPRRPQAQSFGGNVRVVAPVDWPTNGPLLRAFTSIRSFLARAKEWNLLGTTADQLAGLGIASLPRATLLDREAAETADSIRSPRISELPSRRTSR